MFIFKKMLSSKVVVTLVLTAIAIVSTFAGYAAVERRSPIAALQQAFVPNPQQVFGGPNLLVLVEGLDYDYTANDVEFSTNSRSDVIWAVNLDFTNTRVFQLSVPRDMIATMPDGTRAK